MMLNKNPCKICLVQPSCTTPCLDKYDHAKTKLRRLKIVQRNTPPSVLSLGALYYLALNFLLPVGIERLIIVMISVFILMVMCGIALLIEFKYLVPQIAANETLIEKILIKIDGDCV